MDTFADTSGDAYEDYSDSSGNKDEVDMVSDAIRELEVSCALL